MNTIDGPPGYDPDASARRKRAQQNSGFLEMVWVYRMPLIVGTVIVIAALYSIFHS